MFQNNGTDGLDHHIYASTDRNLIDGNEFLAPWLGWAIHKYGGGADNIIRNNIIHDNLTGSAIIVSSGSGDLVYNNDDLEHGLGHPHLFRRDGREDLQQHDLQHMDAAGSGPHRRQFLPQQHHLR